MIEKKLKCACFYSYEGKLTQGEEYIVYKCTDGYYRVNGLCLDKYEFDGLFTIKEVLQ